MLSSSSSLLEELDELDLCILLLLLHTLEGEWLVLRANLIAAWDRIRKEEFTSIRAKQTLRGANHLIKSFKFFHPFIFAECSGWIDALSIDFVNALSPRLEKAHSHEATKPSTMLRMPWVVFYQGRFKLQLCFASWLEQVILMSCLSMVYRLLLYIILCSTKQLPGCHQHFNLL